MRSSHPHLQTVPHEIIPQEKAWELFKRNGRADWVTQETELIVITLNPNWADLCGVREKTNDIVYLATIPKKTFEASTLK